MPHLSDGELHAYLDGALEHLPEARAEEIREHLRTCGTCRSRVAEERELLARSSAILEAGGPGDVEAPPLEELRERARVREERAARERGRGWRTMPRSQAMAWAATVVLALGIGWMTRDLTGVRSPLWQPAVESASVEAPQSEAAPAETPDRGEAPDEAADEDAAATPGGDPGADRLDRPPPPEASAARPRTPTRSRDQAAEREARPSVAPEAAAAPAEEPIEEAAEDRGDVGPSMGATVVGRVVDEASLEPLAGAQVILEDSAGVHHAGVLTRSDGRFALRAERPGTYRAVVELIGYAGVRTDFFELAPDETVARDIRTPARALSLDAITVTGVRAEEAEAAFDEIAGTGEAASLHVPGLPVLRVEARADPEGLLILQDLAGGDTLHLRWMPDSTLEDARTTPGSPFREALPEAWSEVVVRRGGGWLVARAPLGEEALRALLARRR